MPIYEYKCSKCEKIFEKIVSVADSSKTVFCDCSPNTKAKKMGKELEPVHASKADTV